MGSLRLYARLYRLGQVSTASLVKHQSLFILIQLQMQQYVAYQIGMSVNRGVVNQQSAV